jgi:hypothetical protein
MAANRQQPPAWPVCAGMTDPNGSEPRWLPRNAVLRVLTQIAAFLLAIAVMFGTSWLGLGS